eukprot:TRINITY_DN10817_c0_g1_i1.p1 TRINITY_DN10817_c0_g1~~TRINITY_DN10817_c0_g1_i1.p1  ORF type:complete len:293 (-),score=57.39 TRINITY_DN10817_c0_g1_i1:92-970(-)
MAGLRLPCTLETPQDAAKRVRKKLIASRARNNIAWAEVFKSVEPKKIGQMSLRDLRIAIRQTMGVPEQAVNDHDLKMLFQVMDTNGNGTVDLSELLEYLAQGPRRPEDDSARAALRIERTRKNLRMAFQQSCDPNEMSIRKLFHRLDVDSDIRLSPYEFEQFVRLDMKMGIYDISSQDLITFYRYLDKSDDGICVRELMHFIKSNDKNRQQDFSFIDSKPATQTAKRLPATYAQQILESQKYLGALRKSTSMPQLRPTPSMISVGRDRPARDRANANRATPGKVQPFPLFGH